MKIIWKLGEGTVGDVLANLPASRKLAYTSVSSEEELLEIKELLETRLKK